MAALAPSPQNSATPPSPRRRFWLYSALGVFLLTALVVVGWRTYVRIREERIVQKAREFMEAKDYGQALIAAQWALRVSPRNVSATRIMAQLADIASPSQAVFWHRAVAELEPGILENHLSWVEAGLRSGNILMAEQALVGVPPASRSTAAFHEKAARIAQASSKPAEAAAHFSEAVKLDPANDGYRFGLATARLESPEAALHDAARSEVEQFRAKPEFRQRAHRILIQDYFRRSLWKEGFLLAAELQATPDAAFEDRMLLLDLLRKFKRPELHSYLMDVQTIASRDPEQTAILLTWLNQNTMALIAADWAKTLPENVRSRNPVPVAIAESYANLRDWKRLKPMVGEGDWGTSDFMRFALLARVVREEGDALSSRNYWNSAIKATGNRPEALEQLTRFATGLKWEAESTDLLWQVARGKENPQWALGALQKLYVDRGNARGMLNVATRRLELTPTDLAAKNDVAALSLLLNSNVERAIALARQVRRMKPENPIIATTCGFAEHVAGNTEEALKIYRSVPPELLKSPGVAVYFGVVLAYSGLLEEASESLDIADSGKLLVEERELVGKTRAIIKERGIERRAGLR